MPDKLTNDVTLIAGPTASGKTALALALARATGAEIINADALQIYRDVPVLTAQPTAAERGDIVHHLFGVLPADARGSVGDWARRVQVCLTEIAARGRPVILVGGTGLYMRAVCEGLAPIPAISDAIREAVSARYDGLGPETFRSHLLAADPAMARLEPNDRQRHIRAMAVYEATGRPLSDWQDEPGEPLVQAVRARIILEPPRDALYARCDGRFLQMLEAGALDEARRLRGAALAPDLPVMKALGLRELIAHISAEISLEAAIESAQMQTRRFAKRQLTWFRNQTPDWPRADDAEAALDSLNAQRSRA